ncbi:hypothetical protein LR48_Vigan197s000400 [Vigna angularis]|uniref:DUF7148 domain-containing protein n=2 Tax=Phaseolus angularis TaxID=3914 RepID=A0A0L9T5F3_PHAAN|nr:uncharacterized protein LOC108319334 [Vigna angularis]KAG2403037.1 uncharacterized protein HKW66_Vig0246930 [Vigna angularis]KOM25835.1 hypothetical protein LR48_Vigan197s000400 [Vigna angularis]BAT95901.1 hypothetical protein VIGAN_08273300 [Vigna angularis var. angularis]
MMACGSIRMSVHLRVSGFHFHVPLSSASLLPIHHNSDSFSKLRNLIRLGATPLLLPKASARNDGPTDDGITLGTVKLPLDTDLQRFDSLLFQWANSLCQGANLPLPVPLKVDKIAGGARLGFISIEDGKTEVLVYIDCLVSPPNQNSAPMFRAIRKGPLKDKVPPGEPRIMRSLLQALQKSIEIAKL